MSNSVSFEKLGRKCRITITNNSSTDRCTTSYRIGVFDSDEAEEPPAPKSYMELGDE